MPRLRSAGVPEGCIAPWVETLCRILILPGAATQHAALLWCFPVPTIFATFSSHRYWSYPEAQQANQTRSLLEEHLDDGRCRVLLLLSRGRALQNRRVGCGGSSRAAAGKRGI